jgi:hypothetical protein
MLDESQSETDIGDADAGDRKSAVNLFSATPNNSEALTSSLLIQSFSGLPSSPEMVHCKSRGSSERLWPCALERTPTLVREGSLMSPDLRRVTVPIQHTEGHRHGYAGLLGLVQHKSGEASLSTKPSIEAVPTSKADVQVGTLDRVWRLLVWSLACCECAHLLVARALECQIRDFPTWSCAICFQCVEKARVSCHISE